VKPTWRLGLLAAVFGFAGLLALITMLEIGRQQDSGPREPRLAEIPPLSGPSLFEPGTEIKLSAFLAPESAGEGEKPFLLNVFASWCAPCRLEHPVLMALSVRENPQGGLAIVGLAYRDEREDAQRFIRGLGNPFVASIHDGDGRLGTRLGITGVPETFLIAPDGRVLAHHQGPLLGPDAEPFFEAISKAWPPAPRPHTTDL
jgi:DsbE subfamily thiol:disulfide oxidoreductase